MANIIEIKPKVGLGDIKFFTEMSEVANYLGNAEEVEKIEEGEEYKTVIWHYWEKGYSLFFDAKFNNIFTCVEIDNQETILWGKKIFDLKEHEIIDLCITKGYMNMDTEEQTWGEKRISFDDALIDFYFEDNILVSINYGVFVEHENIIIFQN